MKSIVGNHPVLWRDPIAEADTANSWLCDPMAPLCTAGRDTDWTSARNPQALCLPNSTFSEHLKPLESLPIRDYQGTSYLAYSPDSLETADQQYLQRKMHRTQPLELYSFCHPTRCILVSLDFKHRLLLRVPHLSPMLPLSGHGLCQRCWNARLGPVSSAAFPPTHSYSHWESPMAEVLNTSYRLPRREMDN